MTWLLSLVMLLLMPLQQAPKPKLETPEHTRPEVLPPGAPQVLAGLSFDGKEFVQAFNATADRARIVMILSPT
jgi:hypothetical protein